VRHQSEVCGNNFGVNRGYTTQTTGTEEGGGGWAPHILELASISPSTDNGKNRTSYRTRVHRLQVGMIRQREGVKGWDNEEGHKKTPELFNITQVSTKGQTKSGFLTSRVEAGGENKKEANIEADRGSTIYSLDSKKKRFGREFHGELLLFPRGGGSFCVFVCHICLKRSARTRVSLRLCAQGFCARLRFWWGRGGSKHGIIREQNTPPKKQPQKTNI